jgi:hypothetical protein
MEKSTAACSNSAFFISSYKFAIPTLNLRQTFRIVLPAGYKALIIIHEYLAYAESSYRVSQCASM